MYIKKYGNQLLGIDASGNVFVKALGKIEVFLREIAVPEQKLFENIESFNKEVENSAELFRKKAEEKKAAEERARLAKLDSLKNEETLLNNELANLKGLFSGKRRKEIEARLAQIDAELKTL